MNLYLKCIAIILGDRERFNLLKLEVLEINCYTNIVQPLLDFGFPDKLVHVMEHHRTVSS
jgi:hypothetical protein